MKSDPKINAWIEKLRNRGCVEDKGANIYCIDWLRTLSSQDADQFKAMFFDAVLQRPRTMLLDSEENPSDGPFQFELMKNVVGLGYVSLISGVLDAQSLTRWLDAQIWLAACDVAVPTNARFELNWNVTKVFNSPERILSITSALSSRLCIISYYDGDAWLTMID